MIVTMKELLIRAKAERYGIAAGNVFNDGTVKAAFEASHNLRSPLIIACTPYVPIEELSLLARHYATEYPDALVALHLDHGKEYEQAVKAIKCGFTSIMLDKSTLPIEENIEAVREVVRLAHAAGVTAEAELGHVGQGSEYGETRDSGLTRKEEAQRFVQETGVDCLAVAIGTSHGVYKGKPCLDLELLDEIAHTVDVPLVLHGGSDTGDENLKRAISRGMQKINLSTDPATGFLKEIYAYAAETGEVFDANGDIAFKGNRVAFTNTGLQRAAEAWKDVLIHYMKVFGSVGKAR
jgi:fructose-bisphosphate aldolase class II